MGLFINENDHPDVYRNTGDIQTGNQQYAKIDFLSELMKEHEQAYSSLNDSFKQLMAANEKAGQKQLKQWDAVRDQLHALLNRSTESEVADNRLLEELQRLGGKYDQLQKKVETERQFKLELIEQIQQLSSLNEKAAEQLEMADEHLHEKMDLQIDMQKQFAGQLAEQQTRQNEISDRLDQQEALTEKILRQVDHLRSILFERANYLAEKVEHGYKMTSDYVYQFMNRADRPLPMKSGGMKEKKVSK